MPNRLLHFRGHSCTLSLAMLIARLFTVTLMSFALGSAKEEANQVQARPRPSLRKLKRLNRSLHQPVNYGELSNAVPPHGSKGTRSDFPLARKRSTHRREKRQVPWKQYQFSLQYPVNALYPMPVGGLKFANQVHEQQTVNTMNTKNANSMNKLNNSIDNYRYNNGKRNSCSCGIAKNPDDRIVGGHKPTFTYPWIALLRLKMDNKVYPMCGASVVADTFLITAAHCKEGTLERGETFFEDHLEIVLNVQDFARMENPILRKVKKTFTHPDWDPDTYNNDIALIQMDQPVPLTPVCLSYDADIVNKMGRVIGWGYTVNPEDLGSEERLKTLSKHLLEVDLPIMSLDDCRTRTVWKPDEITENMICAGFMDGGKDACNGDSGGPLMMPSNKVANKFYLIGLVSFGRDSCGNANTPGLYTRVSNFLDWVQKILNENKAVQCTN